MHNKFAMVSLLITIYSLKTDKVTQSDLKGGKLFFLLKKCKITRAKSLFLHKIQVKSEVKAWFCLSVYFVNNGGN